MKFATFPTDLHNIWNMVLYTWHVFNNAYSKYESPMVQNLKWFQRNFFQFGFILCETIIILIVYNKINSITQQNTTINCMFLNVVFESFL